MRSSRSSRWPHLLSVALLVATTATAQTKPTRPGQTTPDTAGQYTVITKGLVGGPVHTVLFRSLPLRVEQRNLIMGPGRADSIPSATRTIMELRGGAVTATIDGKTHDYVAGDFWVVEPGSQLRLENRGDVAVIRALYLHEEAK